MIRHVRPNGVPTDVIRFAIMPFLGNDDLPVINVSYWHQYIVEDDHDCNTCVAIFCVVFGIISIAIWACAVAAPQPAGQAIPSGHHYFLPADAAPPFNRSVLVAVDDQYATTVLHPWLLACATLFMVGSLGLLAFGSFHLFLQCLICRFRRHTSETELGAVVSPRGLQHMERYRRINGGRFSANHYFWSRCSKLSVFLRFFALGVLICTIPLINWSAGGRASGYDDEHNYLRTVHTWPSAPPDPSSGSAASALLQFGQVVGACLPQSQLLRRNINEHWRPPKWTCPSHRAFLLVPDDRWSAFNFSQPGREWCVSPCQLDAQGEVWSTLDYQNSTHRWPCVAAIPQMECVSIWLTALWGFAFIGTSLCSSCTSYLCRRYCD